MSEEEKERRLLQIFHQFFMDVQDEFLEVQSSYSRCFKIREFIKEVRDKI